MTCVTDARQQPANCLLTNDQRTPTFSRKPNNTTDAARVARTPYNRAILNAEPAMPNLTLADLRDEITANVQTALREDVGSGDITAQLITAERSASARIITREAATICGTAWVNEVFRQLDPRVNVNWSGARRPARHCRPDPLHPTRPSSCIAQR